MSKDTVKMTSEDKDRLENERQTSDISLAGQAVNLAVKKIMTIGELFAENSSELKSDMYEFSKEARDAGKSIQHLCESTAIANAEYTDLSKPFLDHNSILLASKSLLSSITRVLLLVDIVIVKQLLTTKKKVTKNFKKLESIMHFADFVRSFAALGVEMLKLMCITGNQQNSAKEERRQAQMYSAKQILERSITILVTSSKTGLVHSDCVLAKENRDTVFCQIRRAMDLIHFVIKDSIYDSSHSLYDEHNRHKNIEKETVLSNLKHFASLIEKFRVNAAPHEQLACMGNNNCLPVTSNVVIAKSAKNNSQRNFVFPGNEDDENVIAGTKYTEANVKLPMWLRSEALGIEMREQLLLALDKLLEKTYDFTDSAYTSQENRENILLSCDRCKIDVKRYFNNAIVNKCYLTTQLIDDEIDFVLNGLKKLLEQLVLAVIDQAFDFFHSVKSSVELANIFYNFAIKQDINHLEGCASIFSDHCDHIIDVCKLLRHIALTESLQVQATCLTINLRIYGPQVLVAAKMLCMYPESTPANENFDAFVEMWKWLTLEVTSIAKDILKAANELNDSSLGYLFLRKQKSSSSLKSNPFNEGQTEPIKNALSELDMKGEASDCTEKWNGDGLDENNDIIKRAKNMSAMAFSMYQFTKGSGSLRTTQDLFTQAEYFAEEANCLYKVLRQFSYQVPASQNKKDLLNTLDRVPTFVQALQFTVKDHTVGKAATFVKVDHVIRETKNLMNVINKVVATCFECANKFKLEFTGLSDGLNNCAVRGNDSMAGGIGDSKGTTNSTEGSM